eukprot:c22478_g1_i1 orf=219-497(+)
MSKEYHINGSGESPVTARIILGSESCNLTISEGTQSMLLSEKLVELKGQCMEFFKSYLICHNTPFDVADDLQEGSVEEEDIDSKAALPKKRK